MTQTIAILNQKGGVGKTTSAINIAAYLHKQGKTVLVVDLDPQGNATSGLGVAKSQQETTTYDLLVNDAQLNNAILEVDEGLQLVPANASLAAAEVELVSQDKRELKLKAVLANASYDYVLIDCPPSLGLLSINALTAADWVLIPVQAEYYALEGLSQLLDVVQRIRGGLNSDLELLGVVVTMYDGRTTLSENVYGELKKHFGAKLFDTVVPRNIRLAEAPSFGKSIAEHDKWSKGARAYKQLAKEVDKRVGER
jgi:chromosome partitioning protein